jgi:hypothetical protein
MSHFDVEKFTNDLEKPKLLLFLQSTVTGYLLLR